MNLSERRIAVIGLGYVGLPLAIEFAKTRSVLGFDVRDSRIRELQCGKDSTLEVDGDSFREAKQIVFSSRAEDLRDCSVFIVTVPTPVDRANRPDLAPLIRATETIGRAMSKGSVVIYESTVFPGCTREVCRPILEAVSGLTFNEGFFLGYSPERANPGDREHGLTTITKVTSGSTPEAASAIDALYASIVPKGTHKASSIEVAEAAKVIENTQRDLNVALMNELSIIFNRLGIDTLEVLAAAQTKWNFLPFRPGLVGGHCVGVDPYYLTHRAQEAGYHPEVILAGRRINDRMGEVVAERASLLMMKRGFPIVGSYILILGMAFKENCPDIRNTKVVDTIAHLTAMNAKVEIWDPWASSDQAVQEYGIELLAVAPESGRYDGIIVAVGHREFIELGAEQIRRFGKPNAVLYDVKGIFPRDDTDGRL